MHGHGFQFAGLGFFVSPAHRFAHLAVRQRRRLAVVENFRGGGDFERPRANLKVMALVSTASIFPRNGMIPCFAGLGLVV